MVEVFVQSYTQVDELGLPKGRKSFMSAASTDQSAQIDVDRWILRQNTLPHVLHKSGHDHLLTDRLIWLDFGRYSLPPP